MIKRGNELGIDRVEMEISQINKMVDEGKKHWKIIVKKGNEIKNTKLLDLYNQKIEVVDKKIKKRRNRVLKKLRKIEYQRQSTKYLTKNIDYSPKQALKQIKIMDDN